MSSNTMFDYRPVEVPEDCRCLISPSSLYKFYLDPWEWYQVAVKRESPEFKGNTSTVLGTVCHYCYEQLTKGNNDFSDINNQLDEYAAAKPELELDVAEIKAAWPQIVDVVNDQYLKQSNAMIKPLVECEVKATLDDGIYIAGHVDRIENDTVVDFKTVSRKPSSITIPMKYRIQLMAYAKAVQLMSGREIRRIRIVYGVKPQKTIGPRCIVVTEDIGPELDELIFSTFDLIKTCINKCRKDPELIPLIFKKVRISDLVN